MAWLPEILPLREQAAIHDTWLKMRLERLVPELLEREQVDMWLVVCREYNEDPVIMSLLPATSMSARRRTILVFARDAAGNVERLTLSRYGYEGFYAAAWEPNAETQRDCLARLIRERDPQRIGINISPLWAFGDGLSHIEYELLCSALGEEFLPRLVSAERLCVGWLERRLPEEITAYSRLVEIGHRIIARAFSTAVIHPGITTTDDVVWWMRQTMQDAGLSAWFQPTINIQAPGIAFAFLGDDDARKVIQPGDLLHCDMGFHYLGLATDQQQHAYVLRPGENDAPQGLREALAIGNRLQDIHLAEMQVGRCGNEVLSAALTKAQAEGIRAQIYSHPLGVHGHAAGPLIGLWDQQSGVPGIGDYPLYDDTVYSIELNIAHNVPEWGGQAVRIMLEEDAALTNGEMRWLHGRQESLYLVG
ncbi:MAG: aminopeptidase P family protein [Chloroflexi bacterium]|nr:aminopeptidase P family protein [Chloroflexota bacterium]MXX82257.1 aminopeptidase P family protein [Chloroflexota bacterium]MYA93219.1 aminopeptidase P family protein [Chloroflexota bacterium]MYE79017.1 aminopeptidase P family protein [Chloroflexota bacterium]MYH65580.1 aminopeptidase P family protein [Chloroflexota bacterium]